MMHHLGIPFHCMESFFLYFQQPILDTGNRRNITPKQQQWVANLTVTTNILSYLRIQIESIFCLFVYLVLHQSKLRSQLKTDWFARFSQSKNAFCLSPKSFISHVSSNTVPTYLEYSLTFCILIKHNQVRQQIHTMASDKVTCS